MAFAHNYAEINGAPDDDAHIEVMRQYPRASNAANHLANWIQDRGHCAEGKVVPNTADVLVIPAAIETGLGELGKHGSIFNRVLGSNFRLSTLTTGLPVTPGIAPNLLKKMAKRIQFCSYRKPFTFGWQIYNFRKQFRCIVSTILIRTYHGSRHS